MVKTVAQGFTPTKARLASRLHAFATNLHESCGLAPEGDDGRGGGKGCGWISHIRKHHDGRDNPVGDRLGIDADREGAGQTDVDHHFERTRYFQR